MPFDPRTGAALAQMPSINRNSQFLSGLAASTSADAARASANTTLIQNALNAAKAAGGGEVVVPALPAGSAYFINATIYVPSTTTLRGATPAASLKAATTFTGAHMIELGGAAETQPPFCRLENLTVDAYGQGLVCVYSNKMQEGSGCLHVTACQYGTGGSGFLVEDGTGLSAQNYVMQDIYAYCHSMATGTTAATFQGSGNSGAIYKATLGAGAGYTATMAATATSARQALAPLGASGVAITNTGANTVYVKLGDGTVTASTTDTAIAPGASASFANGTNTYIAAVCASGKTTSLSLWGVAAQQLIALYLNAAKMTLHDLHLESHNMGLLINTGGSASVDGIEGWDGGNRAGQGSITYLVRLYTTGGVCTFRQIKAAGSYIALNDNTISPNLTIFGNGYTGTGGGGGTFVLSDYSNAPRQYAARTVATLPVAPNVAPGARTIASDLSGTAFAFGATATGGGTRTGPVFYDGTTWKEG